MFYRLKFLCLLWVMAGCIIIGGNTSYAQDAGRIYFGGLIGVSRSPDITVIGDSNDRSSVCDEYINPLYALLPDCTVPNRGEGDNWSVPYDGVWGTFGSAYIGYQISNLIRVELEYVLRFSNYGQRSAVVSAQGVNADKLSNELFLAEEWLGTVSMLGLFANVHFDLYMVDGPLLPYAGLGIGLNRTKVDYGSVWSRSPNPDDIRTGRDLKNAEEIAQNLAGVASSGHVTMEDTPFALQIILGSEYEIYDWLAVDLRARWTTQNEFNGKIIWDPLRGHVPNLRLDGSEPVYGLMTSNDFSALVVSVGMKYSF